MILDTNYETIIAQLLRGEENKHIQEEEIELMNTQLFYLLPNSIRMFDDECLHIFLRRINPEYTSNITLMDIIKRLEALSTILYSLTSVKTYLTPERIYELICSAMERRLKLVSSQETLAVEQIALQLQLIKNKGVSYAK